MNFSCILEAALSGQMPGRPTLPLPDAKSPEQGGNKILQKAGQARIDSGGRTGFANGRNRTVNGSTSG